MLVQVAAFGIVEVKGRPGMAANHFLGAVLLQLLLWLWIPFGKIPRGDLRKKRAPRGAGDSRMASSRRFVVLDEMRDSIRSMSRMRGGLLLWVVILGAVFW